MSSEMNTDLLSGAALSVRWILLLAILVVLGISCSPAHHQVATHHGIWLKEQVDWHSPPPDVYAADCSVNSAVVYLGSNGVCRVIRPYELLKQRNSDTLTIGAIGWDSYEGAWSCSDSLAVAFLRLADRVVRIVGESVPGQPFIDTLLFTAKSDGTPQLEFEGDIYVLYSEFDSTSRRAICEVYDSVFVAMTLDSLRSP